MDSMGEVMDSSGIMDTEEGPEETMVVEDVEDDEEIIQAEDALLDSAANEAAMEGSSRKKYV